MCTYYVHSWAQDRILSNLCVNYSIVCKASCKALSHMWAYQNLTETQVWSLSWEDPLEKGMATHSSILAWRIPWTEEPGGIESPWGREESDTTEWLTHTLTHTHTHTHPHTPLIGLYTVCRLGVTNFILQTGNVVDTMGCLSDIHSFHHPNLIANKILNVFKGKIALLQSRYSFFLVLL